MDARFRGRVNRIAVVLLAVFIWGAAGCSKLNQDNYDRLTMGMAYDEVISILGEADDCQSAIGMTSCFWGSEETYIQVKFVGKKVVFFDGHGL